MDPVDGKVNGSKKYLIVTWEEEEEDGGIITILKYRIDAKKVI